MRKMYFITAAIIFALTSCNKITEEGLGIFSIRQFFIGAYIIPSSFELEAWSKDGNIEMYTYIRGTSIKTTDKDYLMYSKMYGDTAYNSGTPEPPPSCIAKPISDITVVCDRDIDSDHPAGSSLNDLFDFYYAPPMLKFIQSHYNPIFYTEEIEKPLTDITIDDCTLLFFWGLKSNKIQLEGDCTFTVGFTTGEGVRLENSITIHQ